VEAHAEVACRLDLAIDIVADLEDSSLQAGSMPPSQRLTDGFCSMAAAITV
jgi:hypothetical protein